jgi:hypothetical protein
VVSLLGYLVNKSILVSIPAIFGSQELRPCLLVGIDMAGLWLQSEAFAEVASDNAAIASVPVFVPFTQIMCLTGPPARTPPHAPDDTASDQAASGLGPTAPDNVSAAQPKNRRNQRKTPQKKRGSGPANS